jgi:hypothetical protein
LEKDISNSGGALSRSDYYREVRELGGWLMTEGYTYKEEASQKLNGKPLPEARGVNSMEEHLEKDLSGRIRSLGNHLTPGDNFSLSSRTEKMAKSLAKDMADTMTNGGQGQRATPPEQGSKGTNQKP